MAWLTENWIWVLFGVAFVAMHLFGHGGPGSRRRGGGHGGHGSSSGADADTDKTNDNQSNGTPPAATADSPETHRH